MLTPVAGKRRRGVAQRTVPATRRAARRHHMAVSRPNHRTVDSGGGSWQAAEKLVLVSPASGFREVSGAAIVFGRWGRGPIGRPEVPSGALACGPQAFCPVKFRIRTRL